MTIVNGFIGKDPKEMVSCSITHRRPYSGPVQGIGPLLMGETVSPTKMFHQELYGFCNTVKRCVWHHKRVPAIEASICRGQLKYQWVDATQRISLREIDDTFDMSLVTPSKMSPSVATAYQETNMTFTVLINFIETQTSLNNFKWQQSNLTTSNHS